MHNPPKNTLSIALVAYPGAQMAALLGLADMFQLLPRLSQNQDRTVVTDIVQPLDLPDRSFDAFVFPPSIEQGGPDPYSPLLPWARDQHRQGALACSVCAGAFWLAKSGLLDKRPATTHWALEREFRAEFPQVDLQPEHILIDDHDVITAGGLMAWLDLGLFLTGRWFGPDMVSRLARHLLIDPAGREQRHYSQFRPNRSHADPGILKAQRMIETHYATPLTVPQLATRAQMSLRSFQRRFQQATGLSPSVYLQSLRIEKSRGALERSTNSIAAVAWSVGYHDSAAFTRIFQAVTGLTPGVYRTRFRPKPSGPLSLAHTPRI